MSKNKQGAKDVMDPSIRENPVGKMAVNAGRACWAAKTLVAEVLELFPETPVEYSNPDGRNTALDVSFDTTVHDTLDGELLATVLDLSRSDSRIKDIDGEDGQVIVSFKSNPRTQDSREPFGLGDALLVLDEEQDQ
jgi:hypothetical protein